VRIVDFHNHYYPPEFIAELRSVDGDIRVTEDAEGNPVIHSPGDYNIVVRGHRDIEFRQQVLDKEAVDVQVLTFTAPGTQVYPPDRAAAFARMVNDSLAAVVQQRGDRFTALATLPLNDPAASLGELERSMKELGFKGCMLFGNVNGVPLSDERFWPLYERASELKAVLYIHPTYPLGVEAMKEYWLMPLVGFTFDTTLAAAGLVFSGIVERFAGITWVLAHLGGAIPYLAERLDRGYRAFAACRRNISRPPSEYLKEFYYDTVNFDVRALQLAIDFAGTDRLLAGSDYPHQIGSLRLMVESIESLPITDVAQAHILGGNAARLLDL
jgi:aminocarboxymuconate-semialdehyde decarboxylase